MGDVNNIIGADFQGWPIYKLTLRDILKKLGFKDINGILYIKDDDEKLDRFVVTLNDDGMGYGVNEQYVTSVDSVSSDKKDQYFFIDKYDAAAVKRILDSRNLND